MTAVSENIVIAGSDTSTPLNLRKRVRLVQDYIDLPGRRVLDAGCGSGEYVEALCALGARAEGVEYLQDKVDAWRARRPDDQRVRRGDLGSLDYPDGAFDAVLLNEVLEHVPDDRQVLTELHRVLRPGGTLILFSPNRIHPFETHGVISRRTGQHVGFTRTFLLPYVPLAVGVRWFDYWARNYWPRQLRGLVEAHGFAVVSHSFVWQTFENISGDRPAWVRRVAPLMRRGAIAMERLPVLRRFGVSQLIVARRADGASG